MFRTLYYNTIGDKTDQFLFKWIGPLTLNYALHKRRRYFNKNATERELFQEHIIENGLRFISGWMLSIGRLFTTPWLLGAFTFFLLVNYIAYSFVRWVYILFFTYHIYSILKYTWNPKICEVKPVSGLTGQLSGAYIIWAYLVFYLLPLLRTFNLIYSILYFNIKITLKDRFVLGMLVAVAVLPVVLIFYIKVGIPLRVIYDSYRYAIYFKDKGNWKNPRSHVIGGILNAYLLPEASNLQAKRIYKNSNSKWNFNPHPKTSTSHLL